jgi:S-adenosylmethionine synthetase
MSQLTDGKTGPVLTHRVKYNVAYKHNLGNFENTEISVGLEQDGIGHPDATFDKVRNWVEGKLEERVAEVVGALKGE